MRGKTALFSVLAVLAAVALAGNADSLKVRRESPAQPDAAVTPAQSAPAKVEPARRSVPDTPPEPPAKNESESGNVVTTDHGHGRSHGQVPGDANDASRGWNGRWRDDGRDNHRHDAWRWDHFHGSWDWGFFWHRGPVIFPVPVPVPYVVRMRHHDVGVYILYTGSDAVGNELVSSVREDLREQGLRVAYSPDDASLELYVVTMDEDPGDPGYGSAVSVSYIWNPGHRFITAQLLDVGSEQVGGFAQSVAGYADQLVEDYR